VGEARRTRSWRLVAGMASHRENELMQSLGELPVIVHDIAAFYAQRGVDRRDREVRRDYDRVTLELLSPYRPDVLVLCGYLYLVTDVLLDAFPGRVINVHDSDLLRVDGEGVPLYRGLHATREAILAGEAETRSTVHVVTAELDSGPVLARSESFPVHPMVQDALRWGAMDIVKAYAYAQREWMMRACWGRLLAEALDFLAASPGGPVLVPGAMERYDPALSLYGRASEQVIVR
jgi:hypothetical protein